jgi:hypothetical protein
MFRVLAFLQISPLPCFKRAAFSGTKLIEALVVFFDILPYLHRVYDPHIPERF